MTYCYKGSINSSRRSLDEDLEIRSLKGYEQITAVNSWLEHDPANFAEFDIQDTVKVCLDCMVTPSRLFWGGRTISSMHMWAKYSQEPTATFPKPPELLAAFKLSATTRSFCT